MAIKTFTSGKLAVDSGEVGYVKDVTLTRTLAMDDGTAIGQTNRSNIPLGKSWTLSCSCDYDPANTAQAALRTAFITTGTGHQSAVAFWEDASHYFGGSAYITEATVRKSVGSPDKLDLAFASNGEIAYT